MALETFADFLVQFLDLCKFSNSGILSSHFGTSHVFKLVFGVLSGFLDSYQVVSVRILGFLRFLVGFRDFCRCFQFAFLASSLFELTFWDFQGFLVGF